MKKIGRIVFRQEDEGNITPTRIGIFLPFKTQNVFKGNDVWEAWESNGEITLMNVGKSHITPSGSYGSWSSEIQAVILHWGKWLALTKVEYDSEIEREKK